jgi:hypothetical protein
MDFLTVAGTAAVGVVAGVTAGVVATGAVGAAGAVWLLLGAEPSELELEEPHPTTGRTSSEEIMAHSQTLFIGINHWKASLSA